MEMNHYRVAVEGNEGTGVGIINSVATVRCFLLAPPGSPHNAVNICVVESYMGLLQL